MLLGFEIGQRWPEAEVISSPGLETLRNAGIIRTMIGRGLREKNK
jgi:hypothetical protein